MSEHDVLKRQSAWLVEVARERSQCSQWRMPPIDVLPIAPPATLFHITSRRAAVSIMQALLVRASFRSYCIPIRSRRP